MGLFGGGCQLVSGISAMFFGSGSTYFMGAWDMTTDTNAYGQTVAVGYTNGTSPYAVIAGLTSGISTNQGFAYRVNLTRETEWAMRASGVDCYASALDTSYNTIGMFSDADSNAVVAKFDTTGTLQWQRQLSTASNAFGTGVATDSSDNVYACGFVGTSPSSATVSFLAKYDSSGTLQWQRKFTAAVNNKCAANCVATDSSGNVYIAGSFFNNSGLSYGWFIAKYDSTGAIQWQKTAPSPAGGSTATVADLVVDGSGNIYMCASDDAPRLYIIKLDSSGAVQWSRRAGVSTNFTKGGICIDGSGYIYANGGTYLVKVDSSGTGQYDRTFSSSEMAITDVATDTQNGMWVAGYIYDASSIVYRGVFLTYLPQDGALTGTYSLPTSTPTSVTYASAGSILASVTSTWSSGTMTDAAGTLTDAAGALSFGTFSNTAYTTAV